MPKLTIIKNTTPELDLIFIAPTEVLREIFSHCDPATLAVVSRVSSGCFEVASRLLYEDIVIKDLRTLALLLRLTVSLQPAISLQSGEQGTNFHGEL
jgi:hypothetical protein